MPKIPEDEQLRIEEHLCQLLLSFYNYFPFQKEKFIDSREFSSIFIDQGVNGITYRSTTLPSNTQRKFHKQDEYELLKNKGTDAAKGQWRKKYVR